MNAPRPVPAARPTVEVVTLSRHEFPAIVAEAAAEGARQEAERHAGTLARLVERLESRA